MDDLVGAREYARIEKAIAYLERHWRDQPSLKSIAKAVNLSPFHFQRLFKSWAGVSPKQFLQSLTAQHAQEMLADGATVLDTALDSGLSGPGRLHDLLVTCDALTPGDVKRRGAGLTIQYGLHDSPFGNALIATTERGVCHLSFLKDQNEKALISNLSSRWPAAQLTHDPAVTGIVADRIFYRKGQRIPVHISGTNFQIKVWQAILHIPPGRMATYAQLSRAIGHPKAMRATGNALAANPIAYLIPCHAVVPQLRRSLPSFAPYRYGTVRRAAILAWEEAQTSKRGDPIESPRIS